MVAILYNLLKTSFRSLLKNRLYTSINIIGLAIGISGLLGIFIFIKVELGYDNQYKNSENVYRIIRLGTDDGTSYHSAYTSGPMAPALKENFHQIVQSARYWGHHSAKVSVGKISHIENNISFIDPDALHMFSVPFAVGNKNTALLEPNSIVLSEFLSKKYFNNVESVLGQTIHLDNEAYTITGVIKETKNLSHLKFDILLPFADIEATTSWLKSWSTNAVATYVQLNKDVSTEELEALLADFIKKNRNSEEQLTLQAIEDVHLYSSHINEAYNDKKGSIANVQIVAAIALLLLIIASINFINLTTAKSSQRVKELAIRKICGSNKTKIILQILIESILISFLAYVLALGLVKIWIIIINPLINSDLSLNNIDYVYALCIALGTGIIAGLYPAIHFSKHKHIYNIASLKSTSTKSAFVRQVLVLIQFVISIALISATLTVYVQREFLLNKNVGFQKENVICVPIKNDSERAKIEILKQELLKESSIVSIGATTQPAGNGTLSMSLQPKGSEEPGVVLEIGSIDADYITTIGMEVIKGRNFTKNNISDFNEGVILNETACRELGWDNPIGKEFEPISGTFIDKKAIRVVGVVKDFHFSSLHSKISPIAFFMIPGRYRHLIIRVQPENIQQTINNIELVWKQTLPSRKFDYNFLDDRIKTQYGSELRANKLLTYFALLVIIISCLGLFGLAFFSTEQRTKEIGVRKVNGAKVSEILLFLNKESVKWVGFAFIIACPIVYYSMNIWLESFAYRITLSWWIFVLAGIITLGIALLSVSWQTFRAARKNPVEALRYE